MRAHTRILTTLAGVVACTTLLVGQGYKMTVSQDRLVNAQNEQQNWLLMNGDYSNTRYSKLAQINRDNIKNLHMVWAMALGGMQDVGQNGPEAEVNPLIDNGMMYTTDGWGTVCKIVVDQRQQARRSPKRAPARQAPPRRTALPSARQTMTSGWPKPRSRRNWLQISSLLRRRARRRCGAEDVAAAAFGGARERVERLADCRLSAWPALVEASRWRSSPRDRVVHGGRCAASSSRRRCRTITCSPASTRCWKRIAEVDALHETRLDRLVHAAGVVDVRMIARILSSIASVSDST